jgi:hypothetical protein
MTISIVSSDPTIQLVAMMIERDAEQDVNDAERLAGARRAEYEAGREQVEAMHRAADAVATGAWIEGGITVVGGAVSVGGIAGDSKSLEAAGASTSSLAESVGRLHGEVAELLASADAERARQIAQQASHRGEGARSHMESTDRHSETVTNLLERIVEERAQGNAAVLSRF